MCWRGREGTAWAAEETESTEQKVREGKRACEDPHARVLSPRRMGLSGDGALNFPHAAGRQAQEAQAGRQKGRPESQL